MRLFTAVELPEAVRAAVAAAAGPLLAPLTGVRATTREHLHVTVRFLGDVEPEALPAVRQALAAAAAGVPSSRARILGFGAFPTLRAPRVIWAGVEDPAGTCAALERAASAQVGPLGFPPEERAFTPHVTLARIVGPRGQRYRRGPAQPLSPPPPAPFGPEFAVASLTLFRSDLSPRGPAHTALDRFPLAAPLP